MADVKGTAGKDTYKVKTGEFYYGLDGDDVISFEKGGIAEGGQGNDQITVPVGFLIYEATICYWSAKDAILVDLDAGYALDGLGSRDTLINVHNVHGFKQSGDKGYGSSGVCIFSLNPSSRSGASSLSHNCQDFFNSFCISYLIIFKKWWQWWQRA